MGHGKNGKADGIPSAVNKHFKTYEKAHKVTISPTRRGMMWAEAVHQVDKPEALIKKILEKYDDVAKCKTDDLKCHIEHEGAVIAAAGDPVHKYKGNASRSSDAFARG